MGTIAIAAIGGLAALGGVLYSPVKQRYTTLGLGRSADKIVNIHGVEPLKIIPNSIQCEDLHLESTTQKLFAACQETAEERALWFPSLAVFTNPTAVGRGTIIRVDPTTFDTTVLKLNGHTTGMVTHGIDLFNDPVDPSILWIFVINHLPEPDRWFHKPALSTAYETAQIDVFKHILGSDEADYIRSVRHPLIQTPNDLLATSPTSFYVSNDHAHLSGALRIWEDIAEQNTAPSTTVIHVDFGAADGQDAFANVKASIALSKIHNSNGLARSSPLHPAEITIADAAGGVLTRVRRNLAPEASRELEILERIQLDSTIDNPSYYEDIYATHSNNASGYIVPGLLMAGKLADDFPHLDRPLPSCVWHVRSNNASVDFEGKGNVWEKRLIFADDGKKLRSASGNVLVGIDPETNGGRKQGWLFVTGFGSHSMVAAKVDL
jgi:hypothetical protein